MIGRVADEISRLVTDEGVPPSEIVVLAPYLTDALRFAMANALARYDIPVRSHRPSRSLAEEPATRCLLTLAALAHPDWRLCPPAHDVTQALTLAIDGMDLVRAQLLGQVVYRTRGRQARSVHLRPDQGRAPRAHHLHPGRQLGHACAPGWPIPPTRTGPSTSS